MYPHPPGSGLFASDSIPILPRQVYSPQIPSPSSRVRFVRLRFHANSSMFSVSPPPLPLCWLPLLSWLVTPEDGSRTCFLSTALPTILTNPIITHWFTRTLSVPINSQISRCHIDFLTQRDWFSDHWLHPQQDYSYKVLSVLWPGVQWQHPGRAPQLFWLFYTKCTWMLFNMTNFLKFLVSLTLLKLLISNKV